MQIATRNIDRRNRFIVDHLPLVKGIAARLVEVLPIHVEFDDLVSAGVVGLISAADRFEKKRGVPFSSYAKHRVRGAMLDSLRIDDPLSRDQRHELNQIQKTRVALSARLKRECTDEELAAELGLELSELHAIVPVSSGPLQGLDLPDGCESQHEDPSEDRPDAQCLAAQERKLLWDAVNELPERRRKLIVLYYQSDLTMKQVGVALGVKESRISQLHADIMATLAVKLAGKGFCTGRRAKGAKA